jgi:phosphoribosyl-AMP cyclohydrolase
LRIRVTDPLQIDFDKAGGLVTAVAQDWKTGEVLMVAHMDRVAWDRRSPRLESPQSVAKKT